MIHAFYLPVNVPRPVDREYLKHKNCKFNFDLSWDQTYNHSDASHCKNRQNSQKRLTRIGLQTPPLRFPRRITYSRLEPHKWLKHFLCVFFFYYHWLWIAHHNFEDPSPIRSATYFIFIVFIFVVGVFNLLSLFAPLSRWRWRPTALFVKEPLPVSSYRTLYHRHCNL